MLLTTPTNLLQESLNHELYIFIVFNMLLYKNVFINYYYHDCYYYVVLWISQVILLNYYWNNTAFTI